MERIKGHPAVRAVLERFPQAEMRLRDAAPGASDLETGREPRTSREDDSRTG